MGQGARIRNAPLPLRKEVLSAVRRKLAEAGGGGASLRLVGGALISIDSPARKREKGEIILSFFFSLGISLYLFVWRRGEERCEK